MKIFANALPRTFLAALLPAALAFSSCGNDDDDSTPAPDQGRVLISHAAAASPSQVTAFVADQQVAQVNYGASSSYINVNAGTPSLRINNGSQAIFTKPLTVAKDQSYSAFVYSPNSTIGSADLLTVPDDLSAPATGQVKVRVVHLAVNVASPVRLTVPSAVPGGAGTDITPDVAFGAASSFAAINPGSLNLSITAAGATGTTRTQVLTVGDGSGSGTGVKNFEAGKIYTIVVRGILGAAVPADQQPKAVIIQNN